VISSDVLYIGRVTFKDSPFYTVVKSLTSVVECKGASWSESDNGDDIDQEPARENTRDTAKVFVNLTADVTEQLQQDRNFRVMVFCAADNNLPPFAQSEIAFPHQVELKCNLDEVKANLRGLKNKPGSTRPADITSFIRRKVGYLNEVQMTYALTQKVSGPLLPEFLLVASNPLNRNRYAYRQLQPYRSFSW
jgi:E3 SUMO-protein ligase PIAS1